MRTRARTDIPGVSSTGTRSGAVVIPQCVGASPGPIESEMPRASSVLNQSASALRSVRANRESCFGFVRRVRLFERNPARVRRPQPTRVGALVARREVTEAARIGDLVHGLVDKVVERRPYWRALEERHVSAR